MTHESQSEAGGASFDVTLINGRSACLRHVRASDRCRLAQGVRDMSKQSRYMRFFSGFREAPAPVLDHLTNVDGTKHIAWGAIDLDDATHPAIAAAHAIRPNSTSDTGEFALGVLDDYHRQGLARLLLAAVLRDCQAQGFTQLTAETLSENRKARRFLKMIGAQSSGQSGQIIRHKFSVFEAIAQLRRMEQPDGLNMILDEPVTKSDPLP